jgi:SP family myo-inositol transporter-like MFS transporter 13
MTLLHFLPESPRVLILRGKPDQARTVLERIYKGESGDILDLKLRVAQQYIEATTRMQREFTFSQRVTKYWSHKPYRRAIISVSGVQAFGQLTG